MLQGALEEGPKEKEEIPEKEGRVGHALFSHTGVAE